MEYRTTFALRMETIEYAVDAQPPHIAAIRSIAHWTKQPLAIWPVSVFVRRSILECHFPEWIRQFDMRRRWCRPDWISIEEPANGPDTRRRGKLWGNKQAVAAAMDAQKAELKPSDAHDLLSLNVEDTDRQGGVSFSVL
jgi:hypothetical protein